MGALPYFGRNGTSANRAHGQMLRTADKHAGELEVASTVGAMVMVGCLSPDGRRVGVLLSIDAAHDLSRMLPATIRDAKRARRTAGRA